MSTYKHSQIALQEKVGLEAQVIITFYDIVVQFPSWQLIMVQPTVRASICKFIDTHDFK